MKRLTLCLAFLGICALAAPAKADPSGPNWLTSLCQNVHCLDNFTAKTAYDLKRGEWMSGGFTELYQFYYLGPAVGFEKAMFNDESAFFDFNVVAHVGTFFNDHIPYVHDLLRNAPFAQGLLQYSTFGYEAAWDFSRGEIRHGPWIGFALRF